MAEKLTRVNFTNLEKILYPEGYVKKSEVIEYYIRIAPRMLEFLEGRAIVTNRFPDGVEEAGFYGKDAPPGTPPWVKTFKHHSRASEREINFIVGGELDTLIWLANLAALEINTTLSKVDAYDKPDLVFIDIDPEPPASFNGALEVANLIGETLDSLGLVGYVKTSGKKGIHIVLPLARVYSFRETKNFVHDMGRILASESEIIVSEFSEGRDLGKVFIDYTLNSRGKTMIAPYSLRAHKKPTVSTPLEWKEVRRGVKSEDLNILTVPKRNKSPWEGMLDNIQKLVGR
jgi:bifunctional non-homologous end joining protein LigD